MARSHAEAGLVKLYAAASARPLRTAQDHAKKRHPDYVAFLATQGAAALAEKNPTQEQSVALTAVIQSQTSGGDEIAAAPPAMSKPEADWTAEEYAECMAWRGLVLANTQRDLAIKRQDAMGAVGFVKIAADSLRSYHLARQKRVQADLEAGRLQPMAAWQSAKSGVLKLVSLFFSFEGRIAQRANPDNPQHAMRALEQWREDEFNPALEKLLAELTLSS